jgi:hypothetical protein
MTEPNRRDTLMIAALGAVGAALAIAPNAGATPQVADPTLDAHRQDFAWLVGRWNVQHRRLKERLLDNHDWEDFTGTSELWLTMNGLGTVDDNVLNLPQGQYRAVGVRAFNPQTRQWLIWWLDGRNPTSLDPPVAGGFANGVGVFLGDDTLRGRPIMVRYQWSEITARSARWEQAFSPDNGASWEVNWIMHFTRAP